MAKKLPPIHPGEILREEFMKPFGLSSNALARALGVTPARIFCHNVPCVAPLPLRA